ncbi:hypothetical protein HRbin21_00416 [bacterium HR21]|nr:hypothetical protein HRbin21_00416 [bacterium HR21]
MTVYEIPEPLLGHARRFLLRRLQSVSGELEDLEGEQEAVEGIRPGEIRTLHARHVRLPERMEGATLIVEGDVVCESDLYHAQLLAAGSVRIEGWCSHALVIALGDMEVHSAIYSQLFARARLSVRREARFTTLQAREIAAEDAVLFGGQLMAAEQIRVRQLRWAFGEQAVVLSIGTPFLQQLEQEHWRTLFRQLRGQLQELQHELERLLQMRRGRPLEQIQRLQRDYAQLQEQVQQVEMRLYGTGSRKPVIEVRESVPADTIVAIHGIVYRVPSELIAVRFTSDGMRVVLESLPDQSDEDVSRAAEGA